jgi:2-amino-4-hydroxy-6-hydroxymethyldihydropteridine diphosphokinase
MGPATLCRALRILHLAGIDIVARSPWYESEPVPDDGQPWYVNGAAVLRTSLEPADLLRQLHAAEAELGRVRGARNAARMVDIDLIAYGDRVIGEGEAEQRAGRLVLPHPLMHLRRFVLQPLADVAPDWRHPRLGRTVREMLAGLPPGPVVRRLAAG